MSYDKAPLFSRIVPVIVVVALALLVAGCGGGNSRAAWELAVTLDEWEVVAEQEIQAGPLRFAVENRGQQEHELVIVKTDLPPSLLPIGSDGAAVTERMNVVQELGRLAPDSSGELRLDITPGKYLLFCNLVNPPGSGHYANCMVTSLLINP